MCVCLFSALINADTPKEDYEAQIEQTDFKVNDEAGYKVWIFLIHNFRLNNIFELFLISSDIRHQIISKLKKKVTEEIL